MTALKAPPPFRENPVSELPCTLIPSCVAKIGWKRSEILVAYSWQVQDRVGATRHVTHN